VVKLLCYKSESRFFNSRWCHWNFSLPLSFRSHYGPGVDSASNRNEYQEHFLGVKAAGAYGWQPYHHPVPLSWNLGNLTSWNHLGHSRLLTGLLYLLPPAISRYDVLDPPKGKWTFTVLILNHFGPSGQWVDSRHRGRNFEKYFECYLKCGGSHSFLLLQHSLNTF